MKVFVIREIINKRSVFRSEGDDGEQKLCHLKCICCDTVHINNNLNRGYFVFVNEVQILVGVGVGPATQRHFQRGRLLSSFESAILPMFAFGLKIIIQ